MALRTNYKDGDSIGSSVINEAFDQIEKFRELNEGTKPYTTINGQEILKDQPINITPKDIQYNAAEDNVEGTVGGLLAEMDAAVKANNPAKVTVLTSANLDDVVTHGMYFINSITQGSPEPLSTQCYLQVIKTGTQFFVQQLWLPTGSVYTRIHNISGFSIWKPL